MNVVTKILRNQKQLHLRLLDLCFVSNPNYVFLFKVASLTQPEDPRHPAFEFSIDTNTAAG